MTRLLSIGLDCRLLYRHNISILLATQTKMYGDSVDSVCNSWYKWMHDGSV